MAVNVLFIHGEGIICNTLFFFIFHPFPPPLHLHTRRTLCVCSAPSCWLVLHNCWLAACSHLNKSNQQAIYSIIYIISWTACPHLRFELYCCSSTVSMSHSFGTISVTPPSKGCPLDNPCQDCSALMYHGQYRDSQQQDTSYLGWSSWLPENNFYLWEGITISWELTLYASGKVWLCLLSQRLGLGSSSLVARGGLFLFGSRGRKASSSRVLTHVSNMSSGRSFRKVALKRRKKGSLKIYPAPSHATLPLSWASSLCHIWLMSQFNTASHHILNASLGQGRSSSTFMCGHKTLPLASLELL